MGVHRLLPAVAPRGGRRLGRIFRPALSFRLWLLLLALLCLFSFAPFGLKFVILVGHGGSMESGISSSHQLHITGNIERFNEEVEQQQLHHYGYGGMQLKAQEESTVGSDEQTLSKLASDGHVLDNRGLVGLWKVVIARNLPYKNMRRTGKRTRSEYAISNHYDRHCVWEESDGLSKFDPSDLNTRLPSYVPEGSFIVRAHTTMSNLFSCHWFNEVDRFTSRDQLSFAYTYLKLRRILNPNQPFYLNMFKGDRGLRPVEEGRSVSSGLEGGALDG
uniref:TOD1/MUCI70 glycosyltransferase-like domain-containing protein n=1 Tax=Populus alba TaxID=43335 RepID=A0A4U5NLG3_POPAL|nr:hypothetical protein D5086_0000264030 [Populus alba]